MRACTPGSDCLWFGRFASFVRVLPFVAVESLGVSHSERVGLLGAVGVWARVLSFGRSGALPSGGQFRFQGRVGRRGRVELEA